MLFCLISSSKQECSRATLFHYVFLTCFQMLFKSARINRVNIDHGYDVVGLFFNDDFILFGDSRTDAQPKLTVLG